jgi:hypothetical protein
MVGKNVFCQIRYTFQFGSRVATTEVDSNALTCATGSAASLRMAAAKFSGSKELALRFLDCIGLNTAPIMPTSPRPLRTQPPSVSWTISPFISKNNHRPHKSQRGKGANKHPSPQTVESSRPAEPPRQPLSERKPPRRRR